MVTLARAHLTWTGVVDDPYAIEMLPPRMRWLAVAFRLPGLRRQRTLPYLAARTLVFDEFVRTSIDDGIRQIVIVGAGYDSRAWRMARPDVTFYEVDQPATQGIKRARAQDRPGAVYVAADLNEPGLREHLLGVGFRPAEPSAFALEGLVVYLPEHRVADLLAALAGLATTASRLAVSFEQGGFRGQPFTRLLAKVLYRRSGETTYFRVPVSDAPAFLEKNGWIVERTLTDADLRKYVEHTPMGFFPETLAYIATACP